MKDIYPETIKKEARKKNNAEWAYVQWYWERAAVNKIMPLELQTPLPDKPPKMPKLFL